MTNTVYFDLDGTLLDPKIGITTSIQYALAQLGVNVPTQEELTWCIGPPLYQSFCTLVGAAYTEQAIVLYRERFTDVGWMENSLYAGITETLSTLVDRDYSLHVATSKPHVYAKRILNYFEMRQYFDQVFGSELDGTRANKTELLRFALTKTQPSVTVTMVGDRKHDIIGALANGMDVIGVTYGYGSSQEIQQAGATKLVDRPQDLLSILSS
ncbi:HAD hydrolase-like protein [Leptolyngbya cf. ectocarpi LEGE 11479]|uniref:HAD hydrolase-like protein n=1 Tax=Leptolyngbya cf. ectocarpi LEGE 11479 TaxID=1828722 RepID=A0A928X3K6_LEPEC|nr:HAD hydrolase-like protein [Leptolyngbya ectocarpi]MBE9067250.1 HAD hydrolase-like protein [Leptolyngbya cf. ectocarpi LEGE 11479]